jgi:hypothetical protein
MLSMLVLSACCSEPPFPMIWASPDLEASEVIKAFGSRAPALHRTDTIGALLADDQVKLQLENAGLVSLASRIAPESPVELLVWEGACNGEARQLVVGVFHSDTGKIVTVDDEQVLFVRVALS